MPSFDKATDLIHRFKRDSYVFGWGVLDEVGKLTAQLGRRALLFRPGFPGSAPLIDAVSASLARAGIELLAKVPGAAPNAPREDLQRMAGALREADPDVVVCLGGGSTIDAAKAAEVLHTLGGTIDEYFGTGRVSAKLEAAGKALTPLVAVQTSASSGAHLTKYSNITDLSTGQKKLVVDRAIVPTRALFDYAVTTSMPPSLTADGAFDGLAHSLEVLLSVVGTRRYDRIAEASGEAIRLVVNYVERAIHQPSDREARTALGLATDLGGYAIMLGGTSGAHLTSFSLVDVLSHGRACAIMNPYYVVFFAPAVEQPLRMVGRILRDRGLTDANIEDLAGRELGEAVAEAMMALSRRIGFPTTLGQVDGFTAAHIERALSAAKDPQLKMKLENMPVPLTVDMIEPYMRPVLEAALSGDLSLIQNVA